MVDEWRRFEERFGIRVAQGYGCSEIGWIAAQPGEQRRIGTVGRPHAYHGLSIVGAEGQMLKPGEMGAVELGGLRDNAYRTLADDGSLRVDCRDRMKTGDLGFLDGEGYLHLTGRAKDLIIRGGVNISPLEIDGVLMQRSDVIEACTVGVPDKVYGEEVVAYVVLRPGAAAGADDILRHCAAALPAFKTPKQIVLCDELPKTERGKLDRKALAERWRQDTGPLDDPWTRSARLVARSFFGVGHGTCSRRCPDHLCAGPLHHADRGRSEIRARPLNMRKDQHKSPEYIKINPKHKVPLLVGRWKAVERERCDPNLDCPRVPAGQAAARRSVARAPRNFLDVMVLGRYPSVPGPDQLAASGRDCPAPREREAVGAGAAIRELQDRR